MGRGGEGPGEFRFPRAIGGAGGIVYVFDVSRGNVQRFDYQGTYLGESAFPLNASGIEMSAAGRIAYNKWASESGNLVTVADFEGNDLLHVGDLVVADVEFMDFTAIKEEIAGGSIPGVLRNEAIPMLAANGDVWVFQQTEAVLERFDLEGARLASTQLEFPEQPAILASFEERNANLGPGTMFPLAPLPVRQRREQHCGDRFAGGRRFLIARQSWSPIGRTRAFPSRGEGNPGGSLPSSAPIG